MTNYGTRVLGRQVGRPELKSSLGLIFTATAEWPDNTHMLPYTLPSETSASESTGGQHESNKAPLKCLPIIIAIKNGAKYITNRHYRKGWRNAVSDLTKGYTVRRLVRSGGELVASWSSGRLRDVSRPWRLPAASWPGQKEGCFPLTLTRLAANLCLLTTDSCVASRWSPRVC